MDSMYDPMYVKLIGKNVFQMQQLQNNIIRNGLTAWETLLQATFYLLIKTNSQIIDYLYVILNFSNKSNFFSQVYWLQSLLIRIVFIAPKLHNKPYVILFHNEIHIKNATSNDNKYKV